MLTHWCDDEFLHQGHCGAQTASISVLTVSMSVTLLVSDEQEA